MSIAITHSPIFSIRVHARLWNARKYLARISRTQQTICYNFVFLLLLNPLVSGVECSLLKRVCGKLLFTHALYSICCCFTSNKLWAHELAVRSLFRFHFYFFFFFHSPSAHSDLLVIIFFSCWDYCVVWNGFFCSKHYFVVEFEWDVRTCFRAICSKGCVTGVV